MSKKAMRRSGYLTQPKTPRTPTIGNVVTIHRPPPANDGTVKGSKVPKAGRKAEFLAKKGLNRLPVIQAATVIENIISTGAERPLEIPNPGGAWTLDNGIYPRSSYGPSYQTGATILDNTWYDGMISGQARSPEGAPGDPIRWSQRYFSVWYRNDHPVVWRYAHAGSWSRPAGSTNATNWTFTETVVAAFPGSAMGQQPNLEPTPFWMQPYQQNSPYPQGNSRQNQAPGAAPSPAAAPTPDIVWTIAPGIGAGTATRPGAGVQPGTSTPSPNPTSPTTRPPSHRWEKPGKRKKETNKAKMNGPTAVMYAFANAGMEVTEIIDIAYDQLPDHIKKKAWRDLAPKGQVGVPPKVSPWDRAKLVYQHADKIKATDVVKGVIDNMIEDALYAAPGKFLKKHVYSGKYYNRPVGYETGPAL